MQQAIRDALRGLPLGKCAHAGLLLDRHLDRIGQKEDSARTDLLKSASGVTIDADSAYAAAFQRWKGLDALPALLRKTLELASPLAIGLGSETPLEIGITLHATYGAPTIPGSAIKGMCKRGAARLRATGAISNSQFSTLFGDMASASHFVFWDAWYDPASVCGKPLHRDVITVHHPKYYQGKNEFPTDFDDPTPIPFSVVRPGAHFLFSISAPEGWGEFVMSLLAWSLVNLGIGGKTNAGYGYFRDADSPIAPVKTAEQQFPQPALRVAPTAALERWDDAWLTRKKDTGQLTVTRGASIAIAARPIADVLHQTLPDSDRAKLKKGGVAVSADIERDGNKVIIVSIKPAG